MTNDERQACETAAINVRHALGFGPWPDVPKQAQESWILAMAPLVLAARLARESLAAEVERPRGATNIDAGSLGLLAKEIGGIADTCPKTDMLRTLRQASRVLVDLLSHPIVDGYDWTQVYNAADGVRDALSHAAIHPLMTEEQAERWGRRAREMVERKIGELRAYATSLIRCERVPHVGWGLIDYDEIMGPMRPAIEAALLAAYRGECGMAAVRKTQVVHFRYVEGPKTGRFYCPVTSGESVGEDVGHAVFDVTCPDCREAAGWGRGDVETEVNLIAQRAVSLGAVSEAAVRSAARPVIERLMGLKKP